MNGSLKTLSPTLRNTALGLCAMAGLLTATPVVRAEDYPSKPVRVVVPWPAGAITDALARRLSEQVGSQLGQPFIVDNRPGASGSIGTSFAAKSAADGYTLMVASSDTHAINPIYYTKLPYATADFADVTGLAKFSYIIAVGKHVPANSLREFVALAKAQPGKYSYASWGNGSLAHLGTELFKSAAGIELLHVPFQGTAPGVTALISSTVDLMIMPAGTAEHQRKAGKLKILAVAGPARSSVVADVPTTAETGYPSVIVQQWFGLVVPKGSQDGVRSRLAAAFSRALTQKDTADWIASEGGEPLPLNGEQFKAFAQSESQRWRKVIADARIDLQ
ncbi:Bug family tripartite tricarboxylate transporter substrate binding protein [Azohydromonas lata]|uniref:Bug family tripartite tricarboxylate transporter substrate binding protein n=1 Tax=Azohydromonas lata TaxID=45677 RepID=UPI0008311EB1|nr:tripartite tricarboxylate transporter substrate binding protein [Azohydromonas lata]